MKLVQQQYCPTVPPISQSAHRISWHHQRAYVGKVGDDIVGLAIFLALKDWPER